LNWREWLLVFGIAIVALFICVYGGRSLVSNLSAAAVSTPTPTPTRVRPTITLAPTPTSAPTFTPTPNIPAAIARDVWVTVVQGVNFRQEAGTTGQIIRTLADGEVLQVIDGPVSANNFTWWKLRDPNSNAEGWAAQDYLQPTAPPQ
jgi:hypothetical protein